MALTPDLSLPPTAVEQIAELARSDADRQPEPYTLTPDSSLVLVKLRDGERIEPHELERYLPEPTRPRGTVLVHDPTDFVAVTNRLADHLHTTVWANVDAGTVTTVVNDHADAESGGWRDHTIQLRLQPDEDWLKWTSLDGKKIPQAEFAEFIEDVAHTVVHPDAATMLEVATSMNAKRAVEFAQGTRLQTGDLQLTYQETTTANAGAKGQLEVPESITVQLAPWRGVVVAELEARLRWKIQNANLFIGYKLLRPDMFKADVFDSLVETIRTSLTDGLPLYRGAEPASLRR